MAHTDASHDTSEGHHDHGLAHVAPVKVLVGVWGALMVLTVITVLATKVDFGSSMNLVIAMVIATVKASLVALFFMHLRYDKPFHAIVAASSLLFALLFVAITVLDSGEYQEDVVWGDGSAQTASP